MVIYSIYRGLVITTVLVLKKYNWGGSLMSVHQLTVFALDIHKTRAEEKTFQLPFFHYSVLFLYHPYVINKVY